MKELKIKNYIGEAADTIQKTVQEHNNLTFIAPTGSGKSSTIFSKEYGKPIFQMLNEEHGDNHITVMLETTTIKQEKDNRTYQHINLFCGRKGVSVPDIKKLMNGEFEYSYQDKVIVTNYAYAVQVITVLNELGLNYSLIFDEIHTLCLYQYKNKDLKKLSRIIKIHPPMTIMNLSATMEKSFLRNSHIVEFKRLAKRKINTTLNKMGNRNFSQTIIDFCGNHFKNRYSNNGEEIPLLFVFFNSTKELNKIRGDIESKSGYASSILLTRNHKHEDYFELIINAGSDEESFDKKVKIVLTTSISEDSIDFRTSRDVTVLYVVAEEYFLNVYGLKQFCGRFREKEEIDLHIIIKKSAPSEEFGERYKTDFSPHSLQSMYDGNFNWNRKKLVDKQSRLFDRRMERVNMIINDNMTETEKESIRRFYTHGLEDNSECMITNWLAAQNTHKEMVNKVIGITNLRNELIRQFGDTINIVEDNLQLEETPMPKGNGLTKQDKEIERDIGEKINKYFSLETLNELIILRESNWEHEFEEYEWKPRGILRKELKEQFPDLTKKEINSKISELREKNKHWLNQIHSEVQRKYIIDLLDTYKVIDDLPMEFTEQELRKLLITKDYVQTKEDILGGTYRKNRLGLVRRKSDVNKDINRLCIKDIIQRFIESNNPNHYERIYNEYPALTVELCDLTVLSEWVKSFESEDKFINDNKPKKNTFYMDNHRELRNLYGELKELNLKMDITKPTSRAMLLMSVVDAKRTSMIRNGVSHKVYKIM